jgi:adenine-specific DNA-methyltransferase
MPILQWLDREKHVKAAEAVPYRLLEAEDAHSAGDAETPNMLIQGDNLEALKALLPYYAGRVKCIYIDPPYNTRSAFEHYDDNLEHSQWLELMYPRLELLRELLAEDGSIWVSIDDNEGHYLKVIMDEIFGRKYFLNSIIWRKNYSPKSSARHFSEDHDFLLVYAKNSEVWTPNLLPRSEAQDKAYRNPDNDSRGVWKTSDLSARNPYSLGIYSITTPGGRVIEGPPRGRYWAISKIKLEEMDRDNRIWWGRNGDAIPQMKRFLTDVKDGRVPQTIWSYEEVGHTQDAKKEIVQLFGADVFGTPKPERLMERVLLLATNTGDLVLDSFLGSGTTAAVAHKMARRYIGIEMGDHAVTHCAPRLRKVIEGEQGGISEAVEWKGGGGFRFYKLGAPVFDAEGRINPEIRFAHLAAHIWFSETHTALHKKARSPLLGRHNGAAYYLLYNGILGDKRPNGGNVLTAKILAELPAHDGQKVIYGEACRIGAARLKDLGIAFKQTPYDLKAR